jgi:hypothetical protein
MPSSVKISSLFVGGEIAITGTAIVSTIFSLLVASGADGTLGTTNSSGSNSLATESGKLGIYRELKKFQFLLVLQAQ